MDLKVFIQNFEFQKFCNAELRTGNATVRTARPAPGGWARYELPLSRFRCDYDGARLTDVNRVDFQNPSRLPALFCLARLRLLR